MKFLSLMAVITVTMLTVANSPAQARNVSAPVSDVLLPSERFISGVNQDFEPYQTRRRHHSYSSHRVRHERQSPGESGGHRLVAKSGARTSVSLLALPHFQCLLTKLEAVGYRIDFMGGYAERGNASAHPTGNALDINQTGRNRVTRRLPHEATAMAHGCGLEHGAVWSNPDTGHFEMAGHYGYVGGGRHYASRYHHRRRVVAEATSPVAQWGRP